MRRPQFWNRCTLCGRFIGLAEFDAKKVAFDYTPDTEFTSERTELMHKACFKRWSREEKRAWSQARKARNVRT